MDIMINRTYLTGKKIKGKNIAITENLTATRMKKLKEAREIYDFKNVWTSEGKFYSRMDQEMQFLFVINPDPVGNG